MTNEQQEEPGFGRYVDRDGETWEHGADGWRFRSTGNVTSWERVQKWAPFELIGETEGPAGSGDDYRAEDRRSAALGLAVRVAMKDEPIMWGEIVIGARIFEAYLKGDE